MKYTGNCVELVNGREILSDHEDIKYWRNYYLYQLANSGYDTSNAEMLDIVNRYALYNTMRFEMIRQKAAELGFDQLSDEEKASMEEEARTIWEEAVTSYMQNITDESTDDERAAARAEAVAADIIRELHAIVSGEAGDQLSYFYRVK